MTRDEIVDFVEDQCGDEEIILFDGLEDAFIGVAERFEPGGHRYFAVYSYQRILESLMKDGSTYEDAVEYIDFNIIGLYAGESTPAILYEVES